MMFLGGIVTTGTGLVGYVYMSEFLTDEQQVYAATAYGVLDSFIVIAITLYFDFLGKNYKYIAGVGFCLTLCSLIM